MCSVSLTHFSPVSHFYTGLKFVNDLTAINDRGEFKRNFKVIYPLELVLKKENLSNIEIFFFEIT